MKDWYEQLEDTLGNHAWILLERACTEISRPDVKFGSPIEEMLAVAMVAVARISGVPVSFTPGLSRREILAMRNGPQIMRIVPQADVSGCRVDFLVVLTGTEKCQPIVVECDGHDFHERTKEQASRDRSRDREFQVSGNIVMRFTGSEIWRDPFACAIQVVDLIEEHRSEDAFAAYQRSNAETVTARN